MVCIVVFCFYNYYLKCYLFLDVLFWGLKKLIVFFLYFVGIRVFFMEVWFLIYEREFILIIFYFMKYLNINIFS